MNTEKQPDQPATPLLDQLRQQVEHEQAAWELPEQYWENLPQQILNRIEFPVPEQYFEQQREQLVHQVTAVKPNNPWMKKLAVAASVILVAGAVYFSLRPADHPTEMANSTQQLQDYNTLLDQINWDSPVVDSLLTEGELPDNLMAEVKKIPLSIKPTSTSAVQEKRNNLKASSPPNPGLQHRLQEISDETWTDYLIEEGMELEN